MLDGQSSLYPWSSLSFILDIRILNLFSLFVPNLLKMHDIFVIEIHPRNFILYSCVKGDKSKIGIVK